MRKHDAFRLAGSSRSEDQRSDALRVYALRQESNSFVFSLFVGQLEHFVISPEARDALFLELLAQIGIVLENFLTGDDPGRVSGAGEVENLARRTLRIAGNASRAGFQN